MEDRQIKTYLQLIFGTTNYDGIDKEELSNRITSALRSLKPAQLFVLTRHFGLDGSKPMSLKSIASHCNATLEEVKLVEHCALRGLRHPKRSRSVGELFRYKNDDYIEVA